MSELVDRICLYEYTCSLFSAHFPALLSNCPASCFAHLTSVIEPHLSWLILLFQKSKIHWSGLFELWEIWFTALEDLSLANGHALDKAALHSNRESSVFGVLLWDRILWREEQGSTNWSILPSWMGKHGVSWEKCRALEMYPVLLHEWGDWFILWELLINEVIIIRGSFIYEQPLKNSLQREDKSSRAI